MFRLFLSLVISGAMAFPSLAQDGRNHSQKKKRVGKHGGKVAKVARTPNPKKYRRVKPIYMAELVKEKSGKISVYFYDKNMKPMYLDKFSKASAIVIWGKHKKKKSREFPLVKRGIFFSGQLPDINKKRLNVMVGVQEGDRQLFVHFMNIGRES